MNESLKTVRLVLRAPNKGDLARLIELAGDYEVSKMLSVIPHPYSREDGEAWLKKVAEADPSEEMSFAIDDGGGLIGVITFRQLQDEPVIGYWLGHPYWGNGYMTEACHAALTWLFSATGCDSVYGEAMEENPASIAVMKRMGFREEGRAQCASAARGEALPALRLKLERFDFLTKTQTEAVAAREISV